MSSPILSTVRTLQETQIPPNTLDSKINSGLSHNAHMIPYLSGCISIPTTFQQLALGISYSRVAQLSTNSSITKDTSQTFTKIDKDNHAHEQMVRSTNFSRRNDNGQPDCSESTSPGNRMLATKEETVIWNPPPVFRTTLDYSPMPCVSVNTTALALASLVQMKNGN